jgi:hypothetical protein
LLATAAVAVLDIATTAIMISHRRAGARAGAANGAQTASAAATPDESPPVGRLGVVLITAAFILLQATNATAMTIMTVYVTETLRLDVMWAGIALGVAAALEVPALLLIGRLSNRFSHLGLIATSCLAGIGYYLGLAFATGPIMLVGLQLLNTWSFAGIAGIGLPLFQHMIPRPGLSTGLYMNTRRIRLHRVRRHHRDRLPHRARPTRHLPYQRRSHPHRTGHHRHCQPNTPVTIWAPSRRPGGRRERSQSLVPGRRLEPDRPLIRHAPGEGSFRLMVAATRDSNPRYRLESAESGLFR